MVRKRVMMPSSHVHAEVHRGRRAPAAHGHDDDRGRDVVDVGAAVRHAAKTGAQRAAEHVVEQHQHDDRRQQAAQRHREVAQRSAGYRAAASSPNRAE